MRGYRLAGSQLSHYIHITRFLILVRFVSIRLLQFWCLNTSYSLENVVDHSLKCLLSRAVSVLFTSTLNRSYFLFKTHYFDFNWKHLGIMGLTQSLVFGPDNESIVSCANIANSKENKHFCRRESLRWMRTCTCLCAVWVNFSRESGMKTTTTTKKYMRNRNINHLFLEITELFSFF